MTPNATDGSAPDPFTLFLASLATCAGLYVLEFCRARQIATDAIRVIERTESDPKTGRLARVHIDVHVPPDFPAKYRDAVARAAGACKVKKALFDPPAIELATVVLDADVIASDPG